MKNHLRTISIISYFSICLFVQDAFTQNSSKHYFTDGLKTAKLHKFESLFVNTESLAINFKKFNRNRKAQKTINYTSLGFLGLGFGPTLYLYATGNYKPIHNDYHASQLTAVGGIFLSSTIALIGNLLTVPFKLKNKNKLLNHAGISSETSREMNLHFGLNENGVGLTFKK